MEGYRKKINDVNWADKLICFIQVGKNEEAKLLAADPKCNVNRVVNGWTPLIWASYTGRFAVVNILLGRQYLLVNHQNKWGNSALMEASYKGSTKCVELLVNDPRTDVNLIDDIGKSALWWAFRESHVPIIKLLISHGANIEGVAKFVFEHIKITGFYPLSTEAIEAMENWKLYLPEFTRFAKTNKYYPSKFKEWAINFILCCLRSKAFPKDIIHLLLEYIARAWKRT